ncbi:LytR/AlgR family response regulator transcription factor, partial [[Clostridium] dakarense]|uniref:LytR/AlgR family response regulator transcription factor n=1 Tax=Faecalimicrobium dakarense TaxID=1301100 RepID=UPI0005A710A4
MFDVCVCCNNINERNNLNGLLLKFTSFNKFKYRLSNFNSLDDLLNNKPRNIDILLISVALKNKTIAFEIKEKVTTLYNNIKVIFIPEIVDFMINGFPLKDFKYVINPINEESFNDELLQCVNELNENNILGDISPKSILLIESYKNKSLVYTQNDTFTIDSNINKLINSLDSYIFYSCSNKHLINLKQVRRLNKSSVIVGDVEVPLSSRDFSGVKTRLLHMLDIKK